MQKGQIGINGNHRRWASFSLGDKVSVEPIEIHGDGLDIKLAYMKLDIEFYSKSNRMATEYKEEDLVQAFTIVRGKAKQKQNDIHSFIELSRTNIQ